MNGRSPLPRGDFDGQDKRTIVADCWGELPDDNLPKPDNIRAPFAEPAAPPDLGVELPLLPVYQRRSFSPPDRKDRAEGSKVKAVSQDACTVLQFEVVDSKEGDNVLPVSRLLAVAARDALGDDTAPVFLGSEDVFVRVTVEVHPRPDRNESVSENDSEAMCPRHEVTRRAKRLLPSAALVQEALRTATGLEHFQVGVEPAADMHPFD